MAGLLAVFFACLVPHTLAAGEVGTVLVLAASKAQAGVVFNYALGFLETSPVLAQEIEDYTTDEIRLRNGIVIAVHAASFRTVRGLTIVAAIFDEAAYWRDDTSANPDQEVYRAVIPALLTTNGMLVGISTGYRKVGLLYQKHHDHFGVDGSDVLVVSGTTEQFNPTHSKARIDAERAADPEAAEAEWGSPEGGFRSDLSAFLDDDIIESAIEHGRPLELPPKAGVRYVGFIDASGGKHDAFTVSIGHLDKDQIIADVVRGRAAPFDPSSVVTEFADLLKAYGIREVTGDSYAGEWCQSAFKDAGLKYNTADLPKSGLYLEGLVEFTRGNIRIPDHPRLLRELRLLERRTSRIGRDIIDHGRNGSDDYANSLFGMIRLAIAAPATVMVGTYGMGGAIIWQNRGPKQRSWSRQPGISATGKPREAPILEPPFALHKN